MKRLSRMTKVTILTFCLMFFLLNLSQVGFGGPCEGWPQFCEGEAEMDCEDLCDLKDDVCDLVDFVYGWCQSGLCYQWYSLYCERTGFLETISYQCDICETK